jgi:tetratricopeptide (TPR) repeat protein
VPDLVAVDEQVAAHVRESAAKCRTAADWAALGEVYVAYGYFPEGEACYRVAAEREPGRADRAYEWAFALERIGRLEEANAAYERAVSLGHSDPGGCWYYVGRNRLRVEKPAEARAAFDRAGDQPSARYEVARLLAKGGDDAAALAVLDRLAAGHPAAVQPHLLRHRIEVLRGGPAAVHADRANRFLTRLPTPFDRDYRRLEDAHDRLGFGGDLKAAETLIAAGRTAEAEPRVRAAFAGDWSPSAADLLAEIEFVGRRPDEAARVLREAVERAGPTPHLLIRLGDAYADAGRLDLAVPAWTRATGLGTGAEVKNAYHRLATYHERAGRAEAARWHMARALFGAGHEEFWAGRLDDAHLLFSRATETDPTLAAAWFYLGETERLRGRAEAARRAYRKCLELEPGHGRAHTGLALLDARS